MIELTLQNCVDIFNKIHKEDFLDLLNLANSIQEIPVSELYVDYTKGNKLLGNLYSDWEKSVHAGNPDYSLYSKDIYLNESFKCWKTYARVYLRLLIKFMQRADCTFKSEDIKSVVDLGCGCGYTTIALKSIFPNANVYGTNLLDTLQYKINEAVFSLVDGCYVGDENTNCNVPKSPDLVFASEFFEHLLEPIVLLRGLLDSYRPKCFIIANSFTQMSMGHFLTYYDNGVPYDGRMMSRRFNAVLRDYGYEQIKTGFYNNRPQVFIRKDTKSHNLF